MRDVADGGEQRRVDHRGARRRAAPLRSRSPRSRSRGRRRRCPTACTHMPEAMSHLRPTRSDQRAGEELPDAPGRRVDGGERADLREVHPRRREEEREETPRHAVVQVVDEARLADAREVPVEQRRAPEDLALASVRPRAGARRAASTRRPRGASSRARRAPRAGARTRRSRHRGRTAGDAGRSARRRSRWRARSPATAK